VTFEDFYTDAAEPEIRGDVAAMLATIHETPLAMVALEAAAAGSSVEIVTGLLRSAAEQVIYEHPFVMVSPATMAAIMATIAQGMQAMTLEETP
jgi:uncharacterized membrane protein YbhN (UPF0104 family)